MIHFLPFIVLLFTIVNPDVRHHIVAAEPSEPTSLWQAAPPQSIPDQPPAQRKPWVLREREIAVDLQLLQVLKDAAARPHPRVVVELFDGARHELDITSTVSRINDTAVIRGTFKPPSRETSPSWPAATFWSACNWAIASTRPNTSPTADSNSSKSIQSNCRRTDTRSHT